MARIPPSPYQSASQSDYDESHLAFAWFALFIYSSILSDCLAVSLSLSLYLSPTHILVLSHSNCRICFKLYQSPFSPFANQINSHSQSNRNPSKAMDSVIYDAISKVQGRPCWAPTLPSTLPCPALLCGCACCVGSALGCTLLISWPHIARHS